MAESSFCAKSECDLFSAIPVQTTVLGDSSITIKPVSSLDSRSQLEFFYGGGGADMYLDLSSTVLRLKLKMTPSNTATGSSAAAYDTGFVNNILHSLFSSCEVFLNEVNVTPNSSDYYNFKSYIQTLLYNTQDAESTHLATSGFAMDVHSTDGTMSASSSNIGWQKRLDLFKSGKSVVLQSKLHGDIFEQPKLIPSGVDLRIRLVFAEENFYLWSEKSPSTTTVKVEDATLFIRQVQINPSVAIAHQRVLEKRNMVFPMKRTEIKTYTLPQNVNGFNIHNAFNGILPDQIIIGFVNSNAFHGELSSSPYAFAHQSLNSVSVVVNGQERKVDDFSFDSDGNHVVPYSTLFDLGGISRIQSSNLISYDSYRHGNALIAFDLTPDKSGHGTHTSIKQMGNIRIHGTFSSNTSSPLVCLVYAQFSCVMELDKYRKPTLV